MGCAALQRSHGIDDRLLKLLADNAAAGTPCTLATVIRTEPPTSAHPGDQAVITADGVLVGWIGGSCSEPLVRRESRLAMADGMPRLVRIRPDTEVNETRQPGELTVATTCPSGGALDIFVDPQMPKPVLVVIGGSPAARTLIQLAAVVGFRTIAVHPGATAEDFPAAERVLGDLSLVTEAGTSSDSWVVVATMGHYDEEALTSALSLPEADVALVASNRRAAAVLGNLRAGGLSDTELARVRAPAGGRRSGSQEEIALQALAEVAGLRRERIAAERVTPADVTGFAVDPVCGMTVDVAAAMHIVEHGGDVYYFCSGGCAEQFRADPQRFSAAQAG
ncbi:MAG TPA: XdhC family protein [Candidatus Dormibacteraeota bacterium]